MWEVAIGTNPKIHRPRRDYLKGLTTGLYERMRSGVIHLGIGTVISAEPEREAANSGLPVGHFHVHLYFPTVTLEGIDGRKTMLIDAGRLSALDDPYVRSVAECFGDPEDLLQEAWIPAIPGCQC